MSDIAAKARSVAWTGLDRLSKTRDTTQAEVMRDIDEGARAGKKIQKVPGGRAPTQVYRPGLGWVKTSIGEKI